VVLFIKGLALRQDKPRVFVQGKGSEDMTTSGSGGGGKHRGAWGSKSTVGPFGAVEIEVAVHISDAAGLAHTARLSMQGIFHHLGLAA